MSCWSHLSAEEKERKQVHHEIEKQLARDKDKARKEYKLLLLGTGGSGKSTFIKQMRIIHGGGFLEQDVKEYRTTVHDNVAIAIKKLIVSMNSLGIKYQHQSNAFNGRKLLNIDCNSNWLNEENAVMIKEIWEDEGIQECYERRNEYHLIESAGYYLPEISRIGQPNYIPTQCDILRARTRTTGIVEYLFTIDSSIFRIVDVGGQRSERRKWIHSFENCSSIIFLTALSEYDQTLEEKPDQNSLEESKALFNVILSYDWFLETSVILFLNKTDLLKEKIQSVHLEDYFPEYDGPKRDDEAARNFILGLFLEMANLVVEGRMIYSHFTCATDTGNIKFVFAAVKDIIMNEHLKRYNLI